MLKSCLCLVAMLMLVLCSAAEAAQSEPTKPQKTYVIVTAFHVPGVMADPCTGKCAQTAARERAKAGPAPAAPLYRVSAAQSMALRKRLGPGFSRLMGISDGTSLIPLRNGMVNDWSGDIIKGQFRPDDLADVIAKYWLFS